MRPSARSNGVATVAAMVSGLAPGKLALTEIVGKSTCGKGETGSILNAKAPARKMASVSKVVAIGRRIKLSEMFTPAAIGSGPSDESAGAANLPKASASQKLVIFTEHRDTLSYLEQRISTLLGRKEAVVCVHGGMGREERTTTQESFRHDPEVKVLLATDAAGEGSTCSART